MRAHQYIDLPTRALVEITEFGNVTCPQSRQVRKLMDEVADLFSGRVSYRYRHYPTLDNDESLLAALALEAAKRQGQFRSMQEELLGQSPINCSTLLSLAIKLGLDQCQFMNDLISDPVHKVIKTDWQSAYTLGVYHAPALFVNGYRFHGKLTLSRLVPFIRFYTDREAKATSYPYKLETR